MSIEIRNKLNTICEQRGCKNMANTSKNCNFCKKILCDEHLSGRHHCKNYGQI